MKNSIKTQLILTFVCLVTAILGVNLLINNFFLEKYYIYQKQNDLMQIYKEINAVENIALPLAFQGVPKKERLKKAEKYLKLVGLEQVGDHMPNQMSGGQQQRVGIARALAVHPQIIFADEPTGNLDSKTTMEIMHLIKSMAKEYNQTIVMVTHDVRLAEFADKVVHIHDGKINKIEERTEDVNVEGVEQ